MKKQTIYCDGCNKKLASGKVENGGLLDYPECKCTNDLVLIITG